MTKFITHFESAIEPAVTLPANQIQTMHKSRPLWARYDLDAVARSMTKQQLAARPQTPWRYRELLPIGNCIEPVSLNESVSALISCRRLAKQMGLSHLSIKDEGQLPTCSFKCRGLSLAVTMARHFGIQRIAMSSNGNAGGAMAMYAARAGMQSVVFMPSNTPSANKMEAWVCGAKLFETNGWIDAGGKRIREGHDRGLWFDISTLKEPYRLEGKKTMGFEIAEQSDWSLPEVIIYPTGGGTALIAMWKAFKELREMGFLTSGTMPRFYASQSNGCQPIVSAWEAGKRFADRHEDPQTVASGIRVPTALGDFMVLDTLKESGGAAVAVEEANLAAWQSKVATAEGIIVCPETATCIGALEKLVDSGEVGRNERVVIVNTAAGQKYFEAPVPAVPQIDLNAETDWEDFETRYLKPANGKVCGAMRVN